MTHVAVVGPFPPLKGGISQHTAKLAEGIEATGATVERHSWSAQYPKRLYKRAQVDADATPTDDVRWDLAWWNPLSWLRTGRRVRRADAVVFPWVSPVHAIPQLVMMLVAGRTRAIVHVHNVLPHEPMPFARLLARLVLRRADALVCHASALAVEIDALGVETTTVVTAHPPDIAIEPTPAPPAPPVRLLFLGMIRNYKGLDIALDALALVDDPSSVELSIVGEVWSEDDRPSPEALAKAGCPVSTRFEYVSDDDMVELLATHHVLVAPYRSATQSGVVSLALAAGRPVVATDVGGLAEAVDDGVTGVLCAPEDPAAFASAIDRCLGDLEKLTRGAAEHRTSWTTYAEDLLEAAGTGHRPSANP